jgi:Mn2+/Fe2+ NRAMP family transporter
MVVGIFGTTISLCLFFWQASEEVEDTQSRQETKPLAQDAPGRPGTAPHPWDTWSGIVYSDVTAYFIILATAVTLNAAGVTDIETAAQAASPLRPLAGGFAFVLFALAFSALA